MHKFELLRKFQLQITERDTYFEMLRKIASWNQEEFYLRLKKPFDRHEFSARATTVNAFNMYNMNSIRKLPIFCTFVTSTVRLAVSSDNQL